ncbi:hypothetical protein CAEBREN_23400 [Caenorhabditis brenneri]|uniref:Uncharacterized protein n=1 Tax=Caenorhabditis brenneri TaxID=135651 RepID=G0NP81_CAEBE|nr:hypothetical protein CAEBREN_23400 [Caenorhabditis brenneri]
MAGYNFLNRSTYASPISVSEQLGPFAPEESWKRTVAPRHAIAYEETCLNMKFAPESFYNEDGLPRPQSVLQVPCARIIYERMMADVGTEPGKFIAVFIIHGRIFSAWGTAKKQHYHYLRRRLVYIQRDQEGNGDTVNSVIERPLKLYGPLE